jgi:hypothetical protein
VSCGAAADEARTFAACGRTMNRSSRPDILFSSLSLILVSELTSENEKREGEHQQRKVGKINRGLPVLKRRSTEITNQNHQTDLSDVTNTNNRRSILKREDLTRSLAELTCIMF